MQELSYQELDSMAVAGGTERGMSVVYDTAAGIFAGGAIGMLCGGPVGAIAGAISGGGHAFLIAMMVE